MADPGQQLAPLVVERTRPARQRSGLQIVTPRATGAPARPQLQTGIAPVGILTDHSLNPPGF
jgi:hypothetical protein